MNEVTNEHYALKVMEKETSSDEAQEGLRNEAKFLKLFNSS